MHPLFELSPYFSVRTISEHYFFQYCQLVDRYAHQRRTAPVFEMQQFFGQLKRILVLEIPPTPELKLTTQTTIILAVIQNARTTEKNGFYYYKDFGVDEVVDLSTVQCVVGRIWDRSEWAIVDRSDSMAIQVT